MPRFVGIQEEVILRGELAKLDDNLGIRNPSSVIIGRDGIPDRSVLVKRS
jgi:hypothetical protein